jgi:hypothetical protein
MAVLIPDAIARPTSRTPAVRERALKEFLPQVLEWLKEDAGDEAKILELDGWADGYEAAKKLESYHYWSADSELVSILDSFSDYSVTRDAVKAWVKEVQPQPTFKLGDRVCKRMAHGGDIVGKITRIYSETAEYIVSKDTDANGCGTYVSWEDAEAVA